MGNKGWSYFFPKPSVNSSRNGVRCKAIVYLLANSSYFFAQKNKKG